MFFSLVRKERKGQKEERFPLLNSFCRLAATGANTLPRPSDHSIATATGSKRSSADSDSLLCHVRLWRTSRFRFGCASVCEHSEMRFITVVPSAYKLNSRPPCTFSGRADNACTNLLGYLVRYVRTRGSMRLRRAAKPPTCALPRVAHTCHAWLARLTRARGRCFLRGRKALLNDFWYFWSCKSTIKKEVSLSLYGGSKPYPVSATPFRGGYATLNPPLRH